MIKFVVSTLHFIKSIFIGLMFLQVIFYVVLHADYLDFVLDAFSNISKVWESKVTVNSADVFGNWAVTINGIRINIIGHTFYQPVLTGRGVVDAGAVFQEGMNSISAS